MKPHPRENCPDEVFFDGAWEMVAKLSYEDVRCPARIWFAEGREKSTQVENSREDAGGSFDASGDGDGDV